MTEDSAVNYLTVNQDGSYGLTATGPHGDLNLVMRERNRAVVFHFGGKQIVFRAVDGRIDAEYDPDDLTAAAQTVVAEVKRLLGQSSCGCVSLFPKGDKADDE